jgi:hypothetical protein
MSNLEPTIENITYINEVKAKNSDLVDLGLEPTITLRANQLMSQGKSFKEAVDTAVKEMRGKVDKLKSNVSPTPPPSGALGEGGGNKPLKVPKPEPEETEEQEIARLREEQRKKGL